MTRVRILIYAAAIVGATCVEAANAADPRYPDWPCAQAKVPELSVAAVWDGPAIDTARGAWTNDPKLRDLVARLPAPRHPGGGGAEGGGRLRQGRGWRQGREGQAAFRRPVRGAEPAAHRGHGRHRSDRPEGKGARRHDPSRPRRARRIAGPRGRGPEE